MPAGGQLHRSDWSVAYMILYDYRARLSSLTIAYHLLHVLESSRWDQ